ncbi:G-protein alpha subunit [Russula ochroleuca]|uniref:G-protein alpha subunit n=1 Tax=Russula ochroleuca TaxID=152965 RepID=A0A9P5MN75_9AGAM|nr:G-protein alpha subunit [Russula ochroleuca]
MRIISSLNRRWTEARAKARSDSIVVNIKRESKSFERQCDVLLMSIPKSEVAASAFIRRMKALHDGQTNDDEPAVFTYEKPADFQRVIWRIREMLLWLSEVKILDPAVAQTKCVNCEYIMNHRIDTDSPEFSFLPEFGRAVQDLWVEEIIPMLLDHPSRLSVDDNAAYFFAEAQRIVTEEYVPSTEDILHATERRVMDTYFKMGELSIRVSHVYGQRCERRKWIRRFEDVTSIIFYASLSDYDERVDGWSEQTWLAESFVLFEAVVNSRWFLRTSIILFLSDLAEFRIKLHEVPLVQYYPEYTGGADANEGSRYILWRFMQLNRSRLNIHTHITEAPDMNNVRLVFTSVKETILQNALKESGVM